MLRILLQDISSSKEFPPHRKKTVNYLYLLGSFPLDGHFFQIDAEIPDELLLAPNFMNNKDIVNTL